MKLMLRLALTLCVITSVAGLGLGLIYSATKDRIAAAEDEKTTTGLAAVLPGFEVDPRVRQAEGLSYWIGRKEDGTVAYAFIAKRNGYSSEVQTMVGIDGEGRILGISVLFQQETPGLGARVQEVQSNVYLGQVVLQSATDEGGDSTPWFADQFKGLDCRKIEVRKGREWHALSDSGKAELLQDNAVSALSGATITTKAVTDSIEEAAKIILQAVGSKS